MLRFLRDERRRTKDEADEAAAQEIADLFIEIGDQERELGRVAEALARLARP
ncbi:MAG TPA: hypothetical protein VG370_19325 [Chloroflexota bacterium]|jgi:hypothetical protein|nr:hypothetical protein [Chloroflexota bacterium]